MKLTLHDCFTLMRERLEAINVIPDIQTEEFWNDMIELSKEGLIRAKDRQVSVDGEPLNPKRKTK